MDFQQTIRQLPRLHDLRLQCPPGSYRAGAREPKDGRPVMLDQPLAATVESLAHGSNLSQGNCEGKYVGRAKKAKKQYKPRRSFDPSDQRLSEQLDDEERAMREPVHASRP